MIATCARDGTPNVSYVSEVHYVDCRHVALSFQFFSKTRQNVLENPRATVVVIHPESGAQYRLAVRYLRTEESGPLFECMKAKLAGIASHTGMAGVFKLRGADVYHVESAIEVPGSAMLSAAPAANYIGPLRAAVARMAGAPDLATLLDITLDCLRDAFGISHAMVLMSDPSGEKLYALATRGYPESGVGAEIRVGEGVIGVAAGARTPIRISHATTEFGYGRAARDSVERDGHGAELAEEIDLPGLPASQSQIAVPMLAGGNLIGVLYGESPETGKFSYAEEDAMCVLAAVVANSTDLYGTGLESAEEPPLESPQPPPVGTPVRVRRYPDNDSIFVGEDYLIKGVAGAILWRLLRGYVEEHRTDYSNRELRLDPSIRLPDVSENLEARLILLQRRLEERCPALRIEKTGRGRFRLNVMRPVTLVDVRPGTQ
ncbi:MAG TPA: GAF domain-containing protein [Steroidobacteraceae bacterium]|nr:GAF domain-containing protein [Steroidobacteraceae bacterium]